MAFIFGTPLYALLYYGLPFIDQLHTPFRWVFPLALAVAVLAGIGADAVAGDGTKYAASASSDAGRATADATAPHTPLAIRVARLLAWLALLGGLLTLGGLLLSRVAYGLVEGLVERVFLGLAGATDAFPSAVGFYSYQFWNVLAFGIFLTLSGALLRYETRDTRYVLRDATQHSPPATRRGLNPAATTPNQMCIRDRGSAL